MIVPRHPERGAGDRGARGRAGGARRAQGEDAPRAGRRVGRRHAGRDGAVLSPVAGSFSSAAASVAHGGQNPLEPARLGCAVAAGPDMATRRTPWPCWRRPARWRPGRRRGGAGRLGGRVLADTRRAPPHGRGRAAAARKHGDLPRMVAEHAGRAAAAMAGLMRAPGFWQHDGCCRDAAGPVRRDLAAATARRVARPGWRAPVPVLCCGNARRGRGGQDHPGARPRRRGCCARGVAVAFITRGYGGRAARHDARRTRRTSAPTSGRRGAAAGRAGAHLWSARDRAAGARMAVADGRDGAGDG